jgi:ribosome recycling factor
VIDIKDQLLNEAEQKMKHTVEKNQHEFNTIRTGRASVAILDRINIDYYGTSTPIKHVANISVPEPRTITISPYEPKFLKEIERQIISSDLGLNPSNDGKIIRLSIPQLNEERRKELVKVVKRVAEDSRIAIRNIRRDVMDSFKKMQSKSEITEDDLENLQDEAQKLTDKYIEEINVALSQKEKEILEV